MDFEDFTNVTDLEKFTSKLGLLMRDLREKESKLIISEEEEKKLAAEIIFRDVAFKLSLCKGEEVKCFIGIPNLCYSDGTEVEGQNNNVSLARIFDLSEFWLLECSEEGRVVSEATGRLLLGSLIQNCPLNCGSNVFVRTGEVGKSQKYFGFGFDYNFSKKYFETFPNSDPKREKSNCNWKRAQVTLEWRPCNLRVNYPGFSGYFDSWHPIERVVVKCVWPQRPSEVVEKFSLEELKRAPIWQASYEEFDETERSLLRNVMLRSLQAAHLREVLFTPMGEVKLISIPSTRNSVVKDTTMNLSHFYESLTSLYLSETERLEKDLTLRFNFIPKRIIEAMRWDRLNESISLLWRRFIRSLEVNWNNLSVIDEEEEEDEDLDELEKSLKLINWCIRRELEWMKSFEESSQLRTLYKVPKRHLYTSSTTLDDRIEAVRGKLEMDLKAFTEEEEEEVFSDVLEEKEIEEKYTVLTRINGHSVHVPIILNCEPPPSSLLTRSLLKNPLAGEVVALNQLKEDMRLFKAWNADLKGISCNVNKQNGRVEFNEDKAEEESIKMEIGYLGFLLWHSPNDTESVTENNFVLSQRMRDLKGQWYELWHHEEDEGEAECCCDGSSEESPVNSTMNFNQRISFNHRSLLGQVLSDLSVQMDLCQLLESVTPALTRRACELLASEEAMELLIREEASSAASEEGSYPLDSINKLLDTFERSRTDSLALEALTGSIFKSGVESLVNNDSDRAFLLNREHEFKITRKETIGEGEEDYMYRESISGFEAEAIRLSY